MKMTEGRGLGRWGKKGKGLRNTDGWLQNSHGDLKNSIGSILNNIVITMYEGEPKMELIYQTFINTYLFLHVQTSVTFKVLSIWCNTPIKTFFHCSEQFLNSLILMPFSTSAVLFHLLNICKIFPFEDLSHMGKQKSCLGQDWVGHRGYAVVGPKLLNTQWGVGRCAHKSLIMKWANMLKVCKNIHWSRTQHLTTMPGGSLIQMGS